MGRPEGRGTQGHWEGEGGGGQRGIGRAGKGAGRAGRKARVSGEVRVVTESEIAHSMNIPRSFGAEWPEGRRQMRRGDGGGGGGAGGRGWRREGNLIN